MLDQNTSSSPGSRRRSAPGPGGFGQHLHAKDTRIEDRADVRSRLETLPNERIGDRAWNYVAVGTGHTDGVAFWSRFATALRAAGYDGPLSIENEDYSLGQRESVAMAIKTLRDSLPNTTTTTP